MRSSQSGEGRVTGVLARVTRVLAGEGRVIGVLAGEGRVAGVLARVAGVLAGEGRVTGVLAGEYLHGDEGHRSTCKRRKGHRSTCMQLGLASKSTQTSR